MAERLPERKVSCEALVQNIASTPDWVTPLVATLQDMANGPHHTFLVPHDCGWSGYEVKRLLTKFDVHVWGLMIVSNTLMFSVPKEQAAWAQTLLGRYGIPVDNPVASDSASSPSHPSSESKGRGFDVSVGRRGDDPRSRTRKAKGIGGLLDVIDKVVDGLGETKA